MLDILKKQCVQIRAFGAEFCPIFIAAGFVFLALAILGPFTYGHSGALLGF